MASGSPNGQRDAPFPRQPGEPTLRAPPLLALLTLFALAVPGARGQTGGTDGITAYLGAGVSLTRMHGDGAVAGRLSAGLQVASRLRIGGRGILLARPVDLGRVAFQDAELAVGYGGIEVAWALFPGDGWSLEASLLGGAGNADVRDTATGVTLDADNFLVVEAGLDAGRRLADPLAAFLSASWRWTSGVEDLPGVSASDLRGPSASVGLRISTS